jgi:2-polyprenyl-3-methyl-5-hydroxy-6-metoxy-1,4-benzoquinol methylase
MNQKTIKEYIRAQEHLLKFLKSLLDEELKLPPMPETEKDRLSELTNLRMLSKTDKWPEAIPGDIICSSEDEKLARASGIINDYVTTDLTDKKFLDFGCAEGHIPYIAANLVGTKTAVGYDIQEYPEWDTFDKNKGLTFTNKFEIVKEQGPYDAILINDIIDHAIDPVSVLNQAKEVKTPTGRIYLRCHPWTSRHGTHLYKELNKAYLHLVFTLDELYGMGLKGIETNKFLNPLETYRKFIAEAGLKISKEEITTRQIEFFFTHEQPILRRIKEQWGNANFPREEMETQFIDYILI